MKIPTPIPLRAALVAACLALTVAPAPTRAQALESAAGAAIGSVGGAYLTMAVLTGGARAGRFLHTPTQMRWELLPVPLMGVAGGVLGYNSPDRLWRGVGWGAGGFVLGAAGGAVAGRILWGGSEGTWSGAVLGSATGMVVGAVLGALTWDDDDLEPLRAQIRIPLGP